MGMPSLRLYLVSCIGLLAGAAGRAEPPMPTTTLDTRFLRDHAATRGFMLGRPVKAKPTPNGQTVLFLRSQPRVAKMSLFAFEVATKQTRELLTPEQLLKGAEEHLSPEEKARRERQRVSVGGFTDYQLSDDGAHVLLSLSSRLYVLTRATSHVRELKTGKGTLLDPKFAPDSQSIAYVLDHDVYVYDLASDRERRLTTGGSARLTHGLAEFVAQEEMGRFSGYWWSPDAKSIAYEEADASGVETWYVADPARPEQSPHPTFYPRPGKANVKVRLGIVPVTGGATVWVSWDAARYEYLASVRWDRHGPLTLAIQDRKQQELVLLRADPATGKTTVLLTEKDPAWLNLYQDVPHWLDDGKAFLWISDAQPAPELELRDREGKKVRVVAPASLGIRRIASVDEKKGVIFAEIDDGHPGTTYPIRFSFREPLDKFDYQILTTVHPNPCVSTITCARDHSLWVINQTTPGAMPHSTVFQPEPARASELPSVAVAPGAVGFSPRVEFVKVGEGSGFFAALIRPHDPRALDSRKKYPVLVDVYGGPHHLSVQAAMRNWLLPQWLADQGFIVVAIDNRGTPGRGRAWERAIYQKFGTVPLDDQVTALQALGQKFPELDLDRVGIYGWSFGGYLAAQAVMKRPDVYKAAVAGAPVVDWLDYDTHYTERYLGLPQESPTAYRDASLLTWAADLKRPLLLVHGTADDNVYFRHTLKLADALFRAGRDFDLLPLSGLTHMVPEPIVAERLWGRVVEHFKKHLGAPR